MFNIKIFKLSVFIISIFSLSSCSQKFQEKSKCAEGTILQGAAVGTVVGAIASKLADTNIFVGAIVGGVIGTIGANKLSSLQCQYHGQEEELLNAIAHNIDKQNILVNKANTLNQKMSLLYLETEQLKNQAYQQSEEKTSILNKIEKKRKEVLNIKKLNSKVMNNTQKYYHTLKNSNFSQNDKQNILNSLTNILSSLHKIENTSTYNLTQLENFKRKIR